MARNFRKRKFTSRISSITQKQIERLRENRLKKSKTFQEKKFFKSKNFDKQLRANVRSNRAKANIKRLDQIVSKLNGTKEFESVVREIFGEKTILKNGRKFKKNSFTSVAQTKRLQKVNKLISKNKFNIKKYLSHNKTYKDVKQFLPTESTINEIIYSIARGKFYLQNKNLIIKHNINVQQYGSYQAQTKKAGIELRNRHYESQNNENKELIDFFESSKKKR